MSVGSFSRLIGTYNDEFLSSSNSKYSEKLRKHLEFFKYILKDYLFLVSMDVDKGRRIDISLLTEEAVHDIVVTRSNFESTMVRLDKIRLLAFEIKGDEYDNDSTSSLKMFVDGDLNLNYQGKGKRSNKDIEEFYFSVKRMLDGDKK